MVLVREIRRPPVWDKADVPEITSGEFAARAYQDLHSPDNTLSFWQGDDPDIVRRVIAGLVCKSGNPRPFSYVLIPEDQIEKLGCELRSTTGQSADKTLNQDSHIDAVNLSGFDAYGIGKLIYDTFHRSLESLEEDEVLECIAESHKRGFLGRSLPRPIEEKLSMHG